MKRIIFVCLGNICRSPMAEFIFKDMVNKADMGHLFDISSAGLSNEERGKSLYPPIRAKLIQHDIPVSDHIAHRISRYDYKNYDYIVGMDENNIRTLRHIFGIKDNGKVSMLLDHTPASDIAHHCRAVADPWYTGDFDAAYEDIAIGCKALLDRILRGEI